MTFLIQCEAFVLRLGLNCCTMNLDRMLSVENVQLIEGLQNLKYHVVSLICGWYQYIPIHAPFDINALPGWLVLNSVRWVWIIDRDLLLVLNSTGSWGLFCLSCTLVKIVKTWDKIDIFESVIRSMIVTTLVNSLSYTLSFFVK